jgi:hypothetical protein
MTHYFVIPAKTGIHILRQCEGAATFVPMDSRLRGNDGWVL